VVNLFPLNYLPIMTDDTASEVADFFRLNDHKRNRCNLRYFTQLSR